MSSDKTEQTVHVEKYDEVTLIGINRPEKKNAVNPVTANQLYHAFKQFEKDEDAFVAVLYGKGGNFCAGYDLEVIASAEEGVMKAEPQHSEESHMGPARMAFSKPVLAAVSGYAVAGGMELALMCDLRVVEESAVMGVFCRRFGVPLIDGGTVRLPKLIGLSRALDLILTGRPVNAKEALEFGIANRVVATGTALGQAIQLAKGIAKFPQECMKSDRRSAFYSTYNAKTTQDALQYEFVNGKKVFMEESLPGAQKFVKGMGKHGNFNLHKASKL
ncbi:hypothetical protein ScPMuIL_009000 [Solemya velum]